MTGIDDLWTVLEQRLSAGPSDPLIVSVAGELTRRRALQLVETRSAALAASGVRQGTRVVLPAGVGPEAFWLDLLALWRLGAVGVPLDLGAGDAEIRSWLEIIGGDAMCIGAPERLARYDLPEIPSFTSRIENATAALPPASVDANAAAVILFTSGTTGTRKGVELSRRVVLGNARATLSRLDIRTTDRLLIAVPFTFVSALSHFLVGLLGGAALIPEERRMLAADLVEAAQRGGATCFGGGPLQVKWLAEAASTVDLALRWIMSSGDRLPASVIARVKAAMPQTRIYVVYGLTELGGRFCILPPEDCSPHEEVVGRPIPGLAATVRRSDGSVAPQGEEGEVYASGDWLMTGYLGRADVTAERLTERGFRTGDLGWLDARGHLRLSGRADDVFKVGGRKVSAIEVQNALEALNIFDDVVVVPVEHAGVSLMPYAFYVAPAPLDTGMILQRLRPVLPPRALPAQFIRVDHIPRTGSGKIERDKLRRSIRPAEVAR